MAPVPLASGDLEALAPWLCTPADEACGLRARSYITRAEQGWDLEESRDEQLRLRRRAEPDEPCREEAAKTGRIHTPYERWVRCLFREAPQTSRYAPLRYRVPARGWLVLRGTRGHHFDVVDEIRAYDLATGAAFVATSNRDHPLDLDVHAGRVSVDQTREVAFTLVTARAVTVKRTRSQVEPRPPGLAMTFSGPDRLEPDDRSSHDSGQTKLAFDLVGGEAHATGELTWPGSSVAWENHAADLVMVLEAGLERGCAPAPLPALPSPPTSAVEQSLAEALVAFRPTLCQ